MQENEQQHQVSAVGFLDLQYQAGEIVTCRKQYSAGRGSEEQLMLQIIAPFGNRFSLKLLLDPDCSGRQLLQNAFVGMPLCATGTLEWERQSIRGFPEAMKLSRSFMSCSLRVTQLANPQEAVPYGCDVSLSGKIVAAPRMHSHPLRPSILLASTILEVSQTQQRKGSRAEFRDIERVPLVIPAQHRDAPKLLRSGNYVQIEGMLERVAMQMKGNDIDQALEALETNWTQQYPMFLNDEQREKEEREYLSRRYRLQHSTVSRIVVGYAELLEGSAQSLRAAQAARRKQRKAQKAGNHLTE